MCSGKCNIDLKILQFPLPPYAQSQRAKQHCLPRFGETSDTSLQAATQNMNAVSLYPTSAMIPGASQWAGVNFLEFFGRELGKEPGEPCSSLK